MSSLWLKCTLFVDMTVVLTRNVARWRHLVTSRRNGPGVLTRIHGPRQPWRMHHASSTADTGLTRLSPVRDGRLDRFVLVEVGNWTIRSGRMLSSLINILYRLEYYPTTSQSMYKPVSDIALVSDLNASESHHCSLRIWNLLDCL